MILGWFGLLFRLILQFEVGIGYVKWEFRAEGSWYGWMRTIPQLWLKLTYFDFFSSLAFLFSLVDFAGFFLTSFLVSLDFAIINLAFEGA